MEANVPVLNEVTSDTKLLVNQGGKVRQIPAENAGLVPAPKVADEGKFYGVVDGKPVFTALPKGIAVSDAAGEAPTAAEFKALLDSLRNAGIIASAT